MTSVTFATSSGSVESLNVSTRHGDTPTTATSQHRGMIDPDPSASNRDDQWVTPNRAGGGQPSDEFRWIDPPRPAWPVHIDQAGHTGATYRDRHRFTVGRDTPTRAAMSGLRSPSAANNTTRARDASPARTEEARTSRVSSS